LSLVILLASIPVFLKTTNTLTMIYGIFILRQLLLFCARIQVCEKTSIKAEKDFLLEHFFSVSGFLYTVSNIEPA